MLLGQAAGAEKHGDEELRKVTVIFSDICGYAAMTEHLGPEVTKEITSRIFREAAAIARKYDGRLDRLIGDCALIIFGLPRQHENDAMRALWTAQELHAFVDSLNGPELAARIEHPLAMHTGVNTGTVVAGQTDFESGTESVVGGAVNVASRLKDVAARGQILIGPDTYKLTMPYLECEPFSPLLLKGINDPVSAFRILALKPKPKDLPKCGQRGIRSPLVGREGAIAVFTNCIERLEAGTGTIMIVLGEAGVGKSRLIAEMTQGIGGGVAQASRAPNAVCLEGRSFTFGQSISYWPFQEILRQYAGITEIDTEQTAWNKLSYAVRDVFKADATDVLPAFASLLAMDLKGESAQGARHLDGEVMGHRIYLAARRFFERLARRGRLILILEDFHLVDESSALLLEHLLPLVESVPILICCAGRPDPQSPVTHLCETALTHFAAYHAEIALSPLSDQESAQLACNLLGIEDLEPAVRELLVGKSEGNPFFMEEVTRSLIDAGALARDPVADTWKSTARLGSIVIPDTVQGMIMSRVDRLQEGAKQSARIEAVIGRTFHRSILQAVAEASELVPEHDTAEMDRHLATLQAIELIRVKQRVPDLQYTFTHALAREAVYESLLVKKRKEWHTRVGQAIERLFHGRLEEFSGLLAYHYAQAEVWEKAQEYLFAAGDQAERVAADAEALAHYRNAMAAYTRVLGSTWDPLQRARLERKMGIALYRRAEHARAIEHFKNVVALLGGQWPASRREMRAAIVGEILVQACHRLLPNPFKQKAEQLASPQVEEAAFTYESLMWIFDSEGAVLAALRLANLSERNNFLLGAALAFSFFAFIGDFLSFPRLAAYYGKRALRIAERIRHPGALGTVHAILAIHENIRGSWAAVKEHAQIAVDAFREGGHWNIRGWRLAIVDFADCCIHEGDFSSALAFAKDLVQLGQDSGDTVVLGWGLARQGYAQKGLGRLEDSISSLSRAMDVLRSVPEFYSYVDAAGELGQCHLRLGDVSRALELFGECSRIHAEHNLMKSPVRTRYMNGSAEAYLIAAEARSDAAARADCLEKAGIACRAALKQGESYHPGMPEALMLRGRMEWLRGRRAAAIRWWKRSLAMAEEMGVRYDLARTLLEMGHRSEDRELLRRARDLFAAIGAQWDVAKAQELMNAVEEAADGMPDLRQS